MRFGEHLVAIAKERDLSKAALARAVGVEWTTVNNWHKHGVLPSSINMAAIVRALRLSDAEVMDLTKRWQLAPTEASTSEPEPSTDDPPDSNPAPEEDVAAELDRELRRALDPERHSLGQAHAVYRAIAQAADSIVGSPARARAARLLLDAAMSIEANGHKLTPARLAASVAALAAELLEVAEQTDTDDLGEKIAADKTASAEASETTRALGAKRARR